MRHHRAPPHRERRRWGSDCPPGGTPMRLTRIARPQPASDDRFSGRSTPRRRRTMLTIAGAGCALGFAVLVATVIDPVPASAATTRVVAVAASVSAVLT